MKIGYSQFEHLKNQSFLKHAIFDKNFGNIDYRFGDKKQIFENRKKIAQELGITPKNIYEMEQAHGSEIKVISDKGKENIIKNTDGIITNKKNVFLMVKTADCFPVVLYDPIQKVIAAVHVGWRGAIEKIFLLALLKMIDVFDSKSKDVLAGIGPGLQTCCFKHKSLLQSKLPEWRKYIKKDKNKMFTLDLQNFIKNQLLEAGIKKENLETMNICTACSKDLFSHIRSLKTGEQEGRFATIVGLK